MPSLKKVPLPGRDRSVEVPVRAIDPHYAWARACGFAGYPRGPGKAWYLVALELRLGGQINKVDDMRTACAEMLGAENLHRFWWSGNRVYGTALVDDDGLQGIEDAAAAGWILRFEVALAPASARAQGAVQPLAPRAVAAGNPKCAEPILFGVIDDGCPFASRRLRIAGGTRVLALWDQERVLGFGSGQAPAGWNFGSAVTAPEIDAYCGTRPAADDWALYGQAGMPELARDASHGAHVLGCLFGANTNPTLLWDQVRDRVPVPRPLRMAPPQSPDLAFVQLPRAYVHGMPRSALAPYRLAALRYILDCAGPATTDIVVPIASENYDGSHDGQSLFDQAVDALVDFAAKQQPGRKLALLVSAGNCLRTNTHERVALDAATQGHVFHVRVLPGNERETLVELWAPHTLAALKFAMQAPGDTGGPVFHSGDGAWVVAGAGGQAVAGIVSLQQPSTVGGHQRCVLFVLPRTHEAAGALGIPGDWRISVQAPAGASGDVCGYIARSTPSLGGRLRSYQSTFPRRYSGDWDFVQDVPAGPGRPYDEYSISGLATAREIQVAGGYTARSKERAPYSAGGPGRNPARLAKFLVDAAAPTDQSRVVRGVLGWGNRSAGTARLAGTSVAAPLAARTRARWGLLPVGQGSGRKDPQIPGSHIME